jgi:hypothetical protein
LVGRPGRRHGAERWARFITGDGQGIFSGTVRATGRKTVGEQTLVATARASVEVLNDRLAFRSRQVDGLDVYVLDTERQLLQRLTEGGAKTPRWSPDGRRVLYGRSGQPYVISDDGRWRSSVFTPEISGDREGVSADWGPDGRHIVFEDGGELYTVEVDGSALVRLTDNNDLDELPVWSPNGGLIAFTSDRDGTEDIWRIQADGQTPTRLTTNAATGDEGIDTSPSWSPDGDVLAFVSGRGGVGVSIHHMALDGSNLTRITSADIGLSGIGCPAWADGADRLVFHAGTPVPSLFIIDSDGSNLSQFTSEQFTDTCPDWSPAKTGREVGSDPALALIDGAATLAPLSVGSVIEMATSTVLRIEVTGRARTTSATAFVIGTGGKALTTNTAVAGATSIIATASDGREFEAVVVGRDLVRDLAVISILGWNGPILTLGNLSHVAENSTLYVVGHVDGVSAVMVETVRRVGLDSDPSRNITWLVTDGDWDGRFEGAPVVDPRGNFVGIVTHRIIDLEQGLTGLAISSNTIGLYLDRLKNGAVLSQ